jgi:hypothetical protein
MFDNGDYRGKKTYFRFRVPTNVNKYGAYSFNVRKLENSEPLALMRRPLLFIWSWCKE